MAHGLVFNIQRYCLHDGPGIRTTVFLKGCPLSCHWCHNPESRSADPEIRVIESRCVRCGECIKVCPQRPLQESGEADVECTSCGECVAVCPSGARQMVGRKMSAREVVVEVLRDRMFHDHSGGGATLSGGEPLAQADFVLQLLQGLRGEAVHTAVDTSGYVPTAVITDAAPWVDLFLFDLKCLDDTLHRQQTGVSNVLILQNLKTLSSIHDNIWIRIPLIQGFNTDEEQLEASARFAASIPAVRQVNLLPYHHLAASKGERATDGSQLACPPRVRRDQIERAAELFRAAGLRTLIGG